MGVGVVRPQSISEYQGVGKSVMTKKVSASQWGNIFA